MISFSIHSNDKVGTHVVKKERAVALYTILILGAATGNLSQTALNTLLNTVVIDFGIGIDVGQWLTTIYMLALGIAVPLSTFFSKKMTYRSYTIMSLSLFAIGTVIDALSMNFILLVFGRVFQAVSAGLMTPIMQSVAMTKFPKNRQSTAMGIGGIAMGFAPNIGPTIGSLFAQSIGWRFFFWFLFFIPVILIILTFVLLPKEESQKIDAKLDIGSFALSAIGFGGILAGLSESSTHGFTNAWVWVLLAVGVVCLVVFLKRQGSISNPLINLGIFKSRQYKSGFWMQNILFTSFMGITLVIPLYVQGPLGGTSLDSGLVLLPGAITALIFNPLAGWLADRIGKERVIRGSAVIFAIGALLAITFNDTTPLWMIAACQAVRGIGISSSMGPTITWMLEELPHSIVNDGSSFTVLVRQAGSSLGTAAMVFIVTFTLQTTLPAMWAYRGAFIFSAVLAVLMFAITFSRVKKKERPA